MFWIFFTISVLMLTYLGQDKFPGKYFFRAALVIGLSYVAAFGSLVAEDHFRYIDVYNEYTSFSDIIHFRLGLSHGLIEPGYALLNVIGNQFHLTIQGFMFFVLLIVNSIYVRLFYKFNHPILTALIFITTAIYVQEINLTRQSISISLFFVAIEFLSQRKWKAYTILVLLMSFFHSTSLLLLPFVIFCFFDLNKASFFLDRFLFLGWITSLVFCFGLVNLEFLSPITGLLFGGTAYERYMGTENLVGAGSSSTVMLINFVVGILFIKRINRDNLFNYFLIFGSMLLNISMTLSNMVRFAMYFFFLYAYCSPSIMSDEDNYSRKLPMKVIQYGFIGFIVIYNLLYNHIFNPQIDLGSEFYPWLSFMK